MIIIINFIKLNYNYILYVLIATIKIKYTLETLEYIEFNIFFILKQNIK